MFRCILFDLDGTLLDTGIGLRKAISYTLNSLGLKPLTDAQMQNFIGPPIFDSLKKTYAMSDTEATHATALFRDIYRNRFLFEAKPYDGIIALLRSLRTTNVKLGVATNKPSEYALPLLSHFGLDGYFHYMQGNDCTNKLNKADIIRMCLQKLSVYNPSSALLIGDTAHDEVAAKQSGVCFLAVSYGFGYTVSQDKVKDAIAVCESPAEIQRFLFK